MRKSLAACVAMDRMTAVPRAQGGACGLADGLGRVIRWVVALLLFAACTGASAQQMAVDTGVPPVDLAQAKWLFHDGDDASWAQAGLDDSGWKTVDTSQTLNSYADEAHAHVFWYRLHLQVKAGKADEDQGPALHVYSLARAYSIFVNGQLMVERGGPPGHETAVYVPATVLRLPQTETVVLALRCVLMPGANRLGKPLMAPDKLHFGRYAELENERRLGLLSGDGAQWLLVGLEIVIGALTLSLFLTQRSARDYLWLALLALVGAVWTGLTSMVDVVPISRAGVQIGSAILDSLQMLAYLEFYSAFSHRKTDLWTGLVRFCAALNLVIEIVITTSNWLPDAVTLPLFGLCWAPLTFYPIVKMVNVIRRGEREARVMLCRLWRCRLSLTCG